MFSGIGNGDVYSMRNLTMLMDYYELTMSNGYFEKGFKDKMVVFDMFYRKNPDNGGFVVSAGLEQLIEYIEFIEEQIGFPITMVSNGPKRSDIIYRGFNN